MRWDASTAQRFEHLYEWHRWYAWRPVRTREDVWVWGEVVWRRRVSIGVFDTMWVYRLEIK